MDIKALVNKALDAGILLSANDGRLIFEVTGAPLSAELREELRLHKRELIAYLEGAGAAGAGRAGGASLPRIAPRSRATGMAPLSYAQQRLWFIDRMGGSSQYNMPIGYRMEGDLDRAAFGRAFSEVVQRHEVLRTNFVEEGGAVFQRIHDAIDLPLVETDLSRLPAAEREAEMRRILDADAITPYCLETSPLIRIRLMILGPCEHVAVINMHHIVSDGWSMEVLMREFAEAYTACREGRKPVLDPLPIQYADYAQWQRDWMEGAAIEGQLAFWRSQLEGIPAVHNLPLDRPRPSQQDFAGEIHFQEFDLDLCARIRRFCIERDVTLFMFLQTAFALLVHRYSNECDIVIGTPIAGREQHETQALIGFFVSTLAIRTRCESGLSFETLLRRNKSTILDVFSCQDTPFEYLVDEIKPARSLSYNPIFQVMFNLQSVGQSDLSLPGLRLAPLFARTGVTKFDLSLDVAEFKDGLLVNWSYKTSLFREETVARMARSYRLLIEGVLSDADTEIGRLPILSEDDRTVLLERWNRTAHPFPDDACIHGLFEAQAARTPDAVAVSHAGGALSYAELDAQANRLAHLLIERGVADDTLVGVCMERSAEMVIALLGILKAGGAYVPLDPGYPDERIRYMAQDAGVALVLTQDALMARWDGSAVPAVSLDASGDALLDAYPQYAARAQPDPSCLAYVIYTSGSTGRPKGVMNSHRALVNRIDWMQREYRLQPDDRVLQKTPYSFDVSVWEFFWPLMVGARIVMARPGGHKDPRYLREVIRIEGVTTLHFVPSMLSSLLDAIDWGELTGVRRVFASGEALSRSLVDRYWATGTRAELHNLYGPTEAAIDVSYWDCRQLPEDHSVPIGRPIGNVQLHVLDAFLQPVPIGCYGELHIGGVAVARGYVGNPELTRDKFVPDPFSATESARLYKTGDLARWHPQGYLEFAGRLDHQVKLNGLRIELGEIEAHLRAQDDIRDCVVVASEIEAAGQRLVAYIVSDRMPDGEDAADPRERHPERRSAEIDRLKAGLKQNLPEFMVPSLYVFMAALPLSANGKVDRKALPRPGAAAAPPRMYVAPTRALEHDLCVIWRQVLQVEQVGIHDNFFDIGGTSLLCIQVQKRIRDELGLDVALTDLFEYPTLSELARFLARGEEEPTDESSAAADASPSRVGSTDIAIIGMAGRFPDAKDLDTFWRRLKEGHEALQHFDDQQLLAAGVPAEALAAPDYVKNGVVLEGLDLFDAAFFGFTPREAEVMDPQQRMLFECAVEALERAGYGDDSRPRPVGVFVGQSESLYFLNHLLNRRDLFDSLGVGVLHANSKEYTSTRLSYKLNLSGPSISVGTACSTSLVAVHQACASLLRDECRMALAGAASVSLLGPMGYPYQEGGIASPDGRCRAFDAEASGTRAGSGAGMVLLKRLDDALADGDSIHAVIKGSAINNDGAGKVGYTAPSIAGQTAVIREALHRAGVSADSIQYVETHGTGTRLGDPIEIKALTHAFAGARRGGCTLGTLKPNIGHLDTAAGVAGLIKAVQVLEHAQFPPCVHYTRPNPQIDFEASPFRVNTALRAWDAGEQPRRAGVSSFGIGGTNAHVVLEEAPRSLDSSPSAGKALLLVSARSSTALAEARTRLAEHLRTHPQQTLADIAYTLQVGRASHVHRCVVLSDDAQDAATRLEDTSAAAFSSIVKAGQRVDTVMMFTGQGAQYAGMSRGLYDGQPVFREHVDTCATLLQAELQCDIREVLFSAADDGRLGQTRYAQPALFVVEYALARLLESWGVRAAAMIGHSLGEYVAACLAGVFALPDALRLVAARGRLMQAMPAGAMLSCRLAEADLQPLLVATGCSLAAVNGPADTVASGEVDAIARLRGLLEERGIRCGLLHTSHAFHSAMMEPVLGPFRAELEQVALHAPGRPFISNLSGAFITDAEATSIDYWLAHLRGTVRFDAGLRALLDETRSLAQAKAMLEVGPGVTLASLAQKQPLAKGVTMVSALRHAQVDERDGDVLSHALGQLWLAGVDIDWVAVHGNASRRRVPLPTYPFERQRYWIDAQRGASASGTAGKAARVEDWFYEPGWRLQSASLLAQADPADQAEAGWLIFADGTGVADAMAACLRDAGRTVVLVRRTGQAAAGSSAEAGDPTIDAPEQIDGYRTVFGQLRQRDIAIHRVVHLWSLDEGSAETQTQAAAFESAQRSGTYSVLAMVQGWMADRPMQSLELTVITRGAWRVTGEETLQPAQASVGGLLKVIPQESEIRCFHVDFASADMALADQASSPPARSLPAATDRSARTDALAARLLREIGLQERPREVAFRGAQRWIRHYQPARHPKTPVRALRPAGVYLITGGLGNVGLGLADHLARTVQARLVLVGRSALPPRERWAALLDDDALDATLAQRLRALLALEAAGAELDVHVADAGDPAQLEQVFERAQARFGRIHGVIHCAGKVQDAMVGLQDLDPTEFGAHYRSKAQGLYALDRVMAGLQLDFCLVMSSLSAVLGGLGFGAYAAANAFADAFVEDRHSRGDERWLSVGWDGWRFGPRQAGDPYSMSVAEGQQAFALALRSAAVPHLVNSTGPLSERLGKWIEKGPQAARETTLYARPELDSTFVEPRNPVEARLAQSWRELLGIDQVGVHDNFFALGGDSLLATRVISMIRHEFSVGDGVFSLRDFFARPQIEAIALAIGTHIASGEAEKRKNQLSQAGIQVEEGVL